MLDSIRNNKRIVQIFLLIITVPFAVWGLDAYFQGGGSNELIKIGRTRILLSDFQEALRTRQAQLRQQTGATDAAFLDSPALRQGVLDGLIGQALLSIEAQKRGLNLRPFMQRLIAQNPDFQQDGVFNSERYTQALAAQGQTPYTYETRLQEELLRQSLLLPVTMAAFTPHTVSERIIALQTQTREVEESLIPLASLLPKAQVSEEEALTFYKANPARFTRPEQIRVDYVVLTEEAIKDTAPISEAELKSWYDEHRDRFAKKQEERQMRHILLLVGEKADEAEKARIRARATELLEEVKKDPSRFEELARTHSQDPGSAAAGGDLGFLSRRDLVKPFADAAFSLKPGEISGVVESGYGFHIIRLEAVHPGEYRSFEEVRADAAAEVRRQMTARHFADASEKFANLVYEQPESLEPAARAFGLVIHKSNWMTRAGDSAQGLSHPKLLAAMFGEEMLKNGRNTEAVEIAPGVIVAAHLLEHQPSALLPFEEARRSIVASLRDVKALRLAQEQGEARLAELRSGKAVSGVKWAKAQEVSRLVPGTLAPAALEAIFRVDARDEKNLPIYLGASMPGQGYALYRIRRVSQPPLAEPLKAALAEKMNGFAAQNDLTAYLAALRQRYKVKVNESLLRKDAE
ncbi:MAG: SurA N-terminal domain-containing protein [Zoogloeaceae bacterium]|jgi:peptidyl-prolyl cis-trans isomerase D|nr:SurA N-terminal domain-containing protein [Zoogloeaceae bacterium]